MPWISKAVWAQNCAEKAQLIALVAKLTDHQSRVERVAAGLTETPAPQKALLPAMPAEIRAYIQTIQGDFFQERARKEAFQRAKADGSWDGVLKDLKAAMEEG